MAAQELDILVVEDDEVFRRDLRRRLGKITRFDSTVTACESIDEARDMLRGATFDVGLFDYQLPDGSSLDLVEYVASDLQDPLAAIIITALDDEETRNEIVAAGAQDYLVKGKYDNSLLERSILLALERRRGAHLRRRLERTNRLLELGSLAADVAHHFNNPVAILSSNLQFERGIADQMERLAEQEVIDPEEITNLVAELRELHQESNDAMSRLTELVSDIQLMGGPSAEAVVPCDVNELVRETVRQTDLAGVTAELSLMDVPVISVDRQRMRKALRCGVENAVEAARREADQGTVEIATAHRDQGVQISIQDSGPGIPPNIREDVFRPFFTTKPPSEGRGLGLPLLLNVVRAHGGEVDMSVSERGTELTIWLPKDAGGFGDTSVETLYGDTDVELVASSKEDVTEDSETR